MSRPPSGWLRAVTLARCAVTTARNLNPPGSAWITSQYYASAGKPVSQSVILQALQSAHPGDLLAKFHTNPTQYLIQRGFTLWTSYEPASRFWRFQWIEGGWLLALSLLLIVATTWLVRRRATRTARTAAGRSFTPL